MAVAAAAGVAVVGLPASMEDAGVASVMMVAVAARVAWWLWPAVRGAEKEGSERWQVPAVGATAMRVTIEAAAMAAMARVAEECWHSAATRLQISSGP